MYYLCLFKRKTKKNTMASYRFKIVGVHYAVNTDYALYDEETQEMHTRTATRLAEVDMERPTVVLIHEPTNPVDTRAVMARVKGERIGYVDKTQLDTAHALLKANGGLPLRTTIDEVEVRKHGWLHVTVDADTEVPVEPSQSLSDEWNGWTCTLPVIAPDDAQFGRMEAEVMLDEVLSKYMAEWCPKRSPFAEADFDLLEEYMHIWLKNALHDLSEEARLTREHYIMALKELEKLGSQNTTTSQAGVPQNAVPPSQEQLPRIKALVFQLVKLRTAICGNKRMRIRIDKWWRELMQSKGMENLWDTWKVRIADDPKQGMNEIVTPLKALPFDLYAVVDKRELFFSRLHYNRVPRKVFWQIVSLLLLRDRTLMEEKGCSKTERPSEEGDRETRYPLEEVEETFTVEIPDKLQSLQAQKILAKLQKKGYLDEDLQPSKLKGWQKGVLAFEITDRLGIYAKWKVMAGLWKLNDKTLRQYYEKSVAEDKSIEFSKKIKAIIK